MPRLLHHISVRYRGGDVHFCEYSAIEGPCIPTSGEKSGFIDVFYE